MDAVYLTINILIFLALAPLFEGMVRRITAKVQSRQGPPVVQPYYDILKLLGKENMIRNNWGFRVAPILALGSIISAISFLPLGGRAGMLTQYADVITVIYLLTMGGVAVLLGALSSKNTYAKIGASREMVTMIMVEPVLAMTFIFGAIKVKSLMIEPSVSGILTFGYGLPAVLMLIVYLMALQAFVGRQPFDIAEAEIEILEGPFIEYSGSNYALFKYYMMLKQMFYASLFVTVFIPAARTGIYPVDIIIQLALIAVVFVFISLIGSTNPRLRIDQAIKYYGALIFLSLCAVGLTASGF